MTSVTTKATWERDIFGYVKFEHLLAGISGGVTATLALHPLDVIKIRLAVHDGRRQTTPKYSGIANAFATILRNEGIRGLYRGVIPNVWGAGSSWGLYFLFYGALKNRLQKGDSDMHLSASAHVIAASEAGFMTLLITNPLWVVKTRLCLQFDAPTHTYNGMVDALVKIYKTEGIRGYYKGLVPGTLGVSHGAVQFMVYEEMKKFYSYYYSQPISTKLGTMEYLIFAAVSKFIAVGATYPYQVVRARLQNQHYRYRGSWQCITETWAYEGWRGFYKGLGTNLLRVTPATMITFVTYENISHLLLRYNNVNRIVN